MNLREQVARTIAGEDDDYGISDEDREIADAVLRVVGEYLLGDSAVRQVTMRAWEDVPHWRDGRREEATEILAAVWGAITEGEATA